MKYLHTHVVVSLALVFCVTVHANARPQATDSAKDSVADSVKFEQLVPTDAWLVLCMDNLNATRERWNATPLGKWVQSDAVKALLKENFDASEKKTKARMQELGVDEDSWTWPDSCGAGLYLTHDDTLDADLPHVLVSAVWGAGADKANTLFEAVLREKEKKDPGSVTNTEIRGKPAKAIRVLDKDDQPKKKRRRSSNSFVPEGSLDHIETLYFVRDGNRFMFGSVQQDLDEALGVYEGVARKSVADSADFKKTLDSVGRGDAWMVMLTSVLHKVAGAGGAQVELVQPYLQTLFGDVHGFGFSLDCDAPGAQLQMLSSIVIDGDRKGLLGLPNPAQSPSLPPKFVNPDARGYGTINVRFAEIMKLLETVVASMPEGMSQPFDASLQQYGPDLSRAFSKLGPDMHVVRGKLMTDISYNSANKTMQGKEDEGSFYAVRCADEQSMMTLLNLFLPQAGFEPRDFNGNTIFDDKSRETSFGFGAGWFFTGKSNFVEAGLRSVTPPLLQTSLADTAECKQVMTDLGTEPVLCWGYQDILMDFSSDESSNERQRGEISASYDSNTLDKIGVRSPMDPLYILFKNDETLWRSAMGPNVFSMTQESWGLKTKIRVLPPTAP